MKGKLAPEERQKLVEEGREALADARILASASVPMPCGDARQCKSDVNGTTRILDAEDTGVTSQ